MLLLTFLAVMFVFLQPALAQNVYRGWQIQGDKALGNFVVQVHRSPASAGYTYSLNVSAGTYSANYTAPPSGGPAIFYAVTLPVSSTYPAGTKFKLVVSSTNDSTFGTHTTYACSRQNLQGPDPTNYLQQTQVVVDQNGNFVSTALTLGIGTTAIGGNWPYTVGVVDPLTGALVFSQTFTSNYQNGQSFGPIISTLTAYKDYYWGCIPGSTISVSDCVHPVYLPGQ